MSASKYRWTPECDETPERCVGDCDLCRVDNLQSGIYTDNPDDQMRYVQTTQPVDLWGNPKIDDDYVLVVRCINCKHRNARTSDGKDVHCEVFNLWMHSDFYCKDGKRKTNE